MARKKNAPQAAEEATETTTEEKAAIATSEEPKEREPAVSQSTIRKAVDLAVVKRLKSDQGS